MVEKEANSDRSEIESNLKTTGTESSVKRNLLSVMNYGKVTQYIYSDGSIYSVNCDDK
jgi:hypothetical protein